MHHNLILNTKTLFQEMRFYTWENIWKSSIEKTQKGELGVLRKSNRNILTMTSIISQNSRLQEYFLSSAFIESMWMIMGRVRPFESKTFSILLQRWSNPPLNFCMWYLNSISVLQKAI
jgi:hypothetical protein